MVQIINLMLIVNMQTDKHLLLLIKTTTITKIEKSCKSRVAVVLVVFLFLTFTCQFGQMP